MVFFFQAEDGIRDLVRSRGLGDVYKRQDLGDKYQKGGGSNRLKTGMGTKDEFLRMVAVMHANGIEVIQDVVLNLSLIHI